MIDRYVCVLHIYPRYQRKKHNGTHLSFQKVMHNSIQHSLQYIQIHTITNTIQVITFCRVIEFMKHNSLFGVHPLGKKTIKSKNDWVNIGETALLFPTVLSLCHFIQEDNKRRQAKLRVKSKVNWSQENVNQLYRSPARDVQPLVKKMPEYLHTILASLL